jgi:O-antigen ligase
VLASIRCGHSWTLSKNQKQFIADVGLVTAILSLFMFFYFSFWDRPVWGEASIRPGYGYAIDRGVLLRLVGFSEDPNFFVIGSLLPFLICLCEKHLKRRVITIAVLGLAMVFTFSRSGFFTVIAAVASYYFLRIKVSHLKFIVPFAIALVPIVLIGFSYFDDLKVNDSADVDRGFVSGLLSRSALLSILLEKESFSFFGNGLGISKEILGIHSHNTYFDFLFEGGVVPFVVFVVITLSYIFSAFYKPSLIKSYGVGVIIGASAVSISFQPLLSLVILLGSKYADKEH